MKSITRQAAKKVFLHSKKAFGIFTLTLLLFTSFLIINQKAEAQDLFCPMRGIEQITDDTVGLSRNPSLNSDGTLVAFFPRQTSLGATLREMMRYTFSIRQHRCTLR